MTKQFNNNKTVQLPTELNNEQAIDAIYDLMAQFFPNEKIQRGPLKIQSVGNYGIINPGAKKIYKLLLKLDKKTRKPKDAREKISMAEIIERDFHNNTGDLFDKISDFARFTIIIPNYASAPAVVASFLAQFGGEINFHESETYEAIHQHTNYKGVNTEFQFHTKEYAAVKKATDIYYHDDDNIVVPKNSLVKEEKEAFEKELAKYCQIVYKRSDFKESLPAVRQVADDYLEKKPQTPKQRLSHFIEIVAKAEYVQKELAQILPKFLAKINEADKIQLDTKNI